MLVSLLEIMLFSFFNPKTKQNEKFHVNVVREEVKVIRVESSPIIVEYEP